MNICDKSRHFFKTKQNKTKQNKTKKKKKKNSILHDFNSS